MSVVTIQLGQCGNQIGTQLFSTLYADATSQSSLPGSYREVSLDRFFSDSEKKVSSTSRDLQARAVLVDMESKAVYQSLAMARREGHWSFNRRCIHTEKRGSGNNWANGYLNHAPSSREVIAEMVRMQVEQCDYLDGFLILMSVAGGTGSGVGAKVTECLRDDYPHATLVNPIVWPYPSGEVIVQDYNSLLTTAHLQASSDAVILLQNQQLHKVCSHLLHLKEITLSDINTLVSHTLASAFQPAMPFNAHLITKATQEDPLMYNHCRLSDIASFLCPHSHYKFLSIKNIPQMPERSHAYSRFLWTGLLKHLRQMLITDSPMEEGMDWSITVPASLGDGKRVGLSSHGGGRINLSLANLLIFRGNELDHIEGSVLSDPLLYSSRTPSSCRYSSWCCGRSFNRYEKCCTLLSNSQSCVQPLEEICRKAWNMFTARAYVYQYEKYGFTSEDFLSSFVAVEEVLKNYKQIT